MSCSKIRLSFNAARRSIPSVGPPPGSRSLAGSHPLLARTPSPSGRAASAQAAAVVAASLQRCSGCLASTPLLELFSRGLPVRPPSGPDEIKGFANIRNFGNKIPERSRLAILAATCILVVSPIFLQYAEGELANQANLLIKPIVGILFAVAIEGSRIAIVGTIVKAKMSGDERIERAAANEKKRMGKA